jgi:nicotinate-nucleotide--dimethylbenzimidazole phosphoribosyltransferase
MSLLSETIARIAPPDADIARRTQELLDQKTKPRRSLGRLEDLACRIAAARGIPVPELPRKAVVVMAGDHGVAAEGVSAYPQEVTYQMVLNFVRGGAAINVLARHVDAEIVVVDMGVKEPVRAPMVRSARIGPGTRNLAREAAMSCEQAVAALEAGIALSAELVDRGVTLLAIGEMGIGNTTPASALTAAFTGCAPREVTGRGTGIDDAALDRKVEVIERALALHRPDPSDPLAVLAALGGFEIAGMAGVVLGGAARRVPVVVDGFISGSAALAAVRLAPAVAGYLVASHRSVEVGHRKVLEALGALPLLDLDLRLGEGTGAVLSMGLVEASLRILREMATFASAGVSDSGA